MFSSIGTFRYSPKSESIPMSSKWWLVIDVDPDLGRLYREFFNWENRVYCKLQRPAWEAHISIIRDEEPKDDLKCLWERYNGQAVEFEYDPTILTMDFSRYYWLKVNCPRALEIRKELGLPDPEIPLHLTIGIYLEKETR